MIKRMILMASLVSVVVMLVLLNFTTPLKIGPLGVLLFFTMFYVLSFGLTVGAMWVFWRLMDRERELSTKNYLMAAVIGLLPMMTLLIGSQGALNYWTMGLLGFFTILAGLLIYRRS